MRATPTRRAVLGGALAALATPALARFPTEVPDGLVFFVGNSFTRQHGVPGLVCRIAAHAGIPAHCHPHTTNGAFLKDSTDFPRLIGQERATPVPGTVVLQDHSTAPLTEKGRRASAEAMSAYAGRFRKAVLFETWPRAAGHPLYARPGMPPGPEEMAGITHDHYRAQAARLGAKLAPVATAWIEAMAAGTDLHARDGYHANLAGAWLSALRIASALGVPEAREAPAPDGLDPALAARLGTLAARYT